MISEDPSKNFENICYFQKKLRLVLEPQLWVYMCHLLRQSSIVFLGLWWHQISAEPNFLAWKDIGSSCHLTFDALWHIRKKVISRLRGWSIEHICHPSHSPLSLPGGFLMLRWSVATFEFWHEFHLIVNPARLPAYFCSQWASVNPILEWQISHLTGSWKQLPPTNQCNHNGPHSKQLEEEQSDWFSL